MHSRAKFSLGCCWRLWAWSSQINIAGSVATASSKSSQLPDALSAERVDLQPHEISVADFDGAGGKMAVPEEGQLFLQGTRPGGHARQPAITHLLEVAELLPLDLLHHLAAFFGCGALFLLRLAGILVIAKHPLNVLALLGQVRVGAGPVRGRTGGIGNVFEIDKVGNGVRHRHGRQFFNLRRRPAKPGATIEMGRGGKIPLRCWQRFQHTSIDAGGAQMVTERWNRRPACPRQASGRAVKRSIGYKATAHSNRPGVQRPSPPFTSNQRNSAK